MAVIQRALISVYDKTGVVEFATTLSELGIELISTGGTFRALKDAGLSVKEVSEHTGAKEMMGGRVKTLHPKIHGGILGRRDVDQDVMAEADIAPIDLVIVNLYPFVETISQKNCTFEDAIEQIDVGGPTMIRAAAKNHKDVLVVVDPADYSVIADELKQNSGDGKTLDNRLYAQKAFKMTAEYDAAIVNYFKKINDQDKHSVEFPEVFQPTFIKSHVLRYGENPHQQAAFYVEPERPQGIVASIKQLQGKPLSYNNVMDTNAALECVKDFDENPCCVIVKHANPCGVAIGQTALEAYELAHTTDPISAFGGIIAFNRPLTADVAEAIINKQFVEVLVAPSVEPDALTVTASKPNVRVLSCGQWIQDNVPTLDYRRVQGGLLVQTNDSTHVIDDEALDFVTDASPTEAQRRDLLFAWRVAKHVKSNAIVYAKNNQTIGIGAGQMSRVDSTKIAQSKAEEQGLRVKGAVMASDAFFPFRDSIDEAAKAGITCIIQPGGSMRDEEVIEAANEHGMVMAFTGIRHFNH